MMTPEDRIPPNSSRRSGRLGRAESEMLHDLLLEWCSNHNVSPSSLDAYDVAEELADLFAFGVRDHDTLREAIASR